AVDDPLLGGPVDGRDRLGEGRLGGLGITATYGLADLLDRRPHGGTGGAILLALQGRLRGALLGRLGVRHREAPCRPRGDAVYGLDRAPRRRDKSREDGSLSTPGRGRNPEALEPLAGQIGLVRAGEGADDLLQAGDPFVAPAELDQRIALLEQRARRL